MRTCHVSVIFFSYYKTSPLIEFIEGRLELVYIAACNQSSLSDVSLPLPIIKDTYPPNIYCGLSYGFIENPESVKTNLTHGNFCSKYNHDSDSARLPKAFPKEEVIVNLGTHTHTRNVVEFKFCYSMYFGTAARFGVT